MATKVLDTINLIGKDTRKVVKLSGTFFYKEGTKMITDFPDGYHRYRYNGVVFTVPVDNDFHADLKNGKVHEVVINQVEDDNDKELTRYQLDTHINKQAYIEDAMFVAQLEAIEAGRGPVAILSAEEVEAMA
jgi:hypothetical protein